MGLQKGWIGQQLDRGFLHLSGALCLDHVTDQALAHRLQILDPTGCRACGRDDRPVVLIDDIAALVKEVIDDFYDDAEESMGHGFSYDDTAVVVSEICEHALTEPIAEITTKDLAAAIDAAGGSGQWLSGRQQDYLEWRWDLYCHNVKHTNRYVFPTAGAGNSIHPAPGEAIELLQQIMTYVDGPLSLVRRFESNLSVFRGRLAESATEFKHTAEALGPPPSTRAAANRMSPAGVSLFYGSEDPQAAIAEIAGHGPQPLAVVGEFRSTRALSILDLTSKPPPPGSLFDPEKRHAITMWGFLQTFIQKVTRPVIPDGREHVEYAPTQVLTEYIRWMCRNQVDGIALPSGPGRGKKTYVLFIGPEAVTDAPGEAEHWLTLAPDAVTVYDVKRTYEGLPHTGHWHTNHRQGSIDSANTS